MGQFYCSFMLRTGSVQFSGKISASQELKRFLAYSARLFADKKPRYRMFIYGRSEE